MAPSPHDARRATPPADAAAHPEPRNPDFLAWALADDAHPDDLGELHRRALRDRARRAMDADAEAIARGIPARRASLEWLAQQLPNNHPNRAAVRALARRAGMPVRPIPLHERRAALIAARDRACAELRAMISAAVPLALREAHARAATASLRSAPVWRLPRALAPQRQPAWCKREPIPPHSAAQDCRPIPALDRRIAPARASERPAHTHRHPRTPAPAPVCVTRNGTKLMPTYNPRAGRTSAPTATPRWYVLRRADCDLPPRAARNGTPRSQAGAGRLLRGDARDPRRHSCRSKLAPRRTRVRSGRRPQPGAAAHVPP